MSDELTQALAGQHEDARWRLAAGGVAADWMFDELRQTWRDAQAEARRAYAQWREDAGIHAYARYRAAQDRADAAQDALARRAAP